MTTQVAMPLVLAEGPVAWLALVGCIGMVGVIAVLHPPLRRALVALWVFTLAALGYVRQRLRGDRNAGPPAWRQAFETLGPTYIKLGQLIASSSGLVPKRYVEEFRQCLDRVPPQPWPVAKKTLSEALGRAPEEVFGELSAVPLASASIAQVHAATGPNDEGVPSDLVIKVQRRGLPVLIDADMKMLGLGAGFLQRIPRVKNANPLGIVQEFDRTIHEELDFLAEADHMDEFNRIMRQLGRTDVCAPRPVHSLCRRDVLTMERFHGARVDDVDELRRRGFDLASIENKLIVGMHAWFQSMIRFGFFHGDVHAGNLMLLDDGRVGFLDFGIIGRFDRERRRQIADYMVAFAVQDFHAVARVMARMGVVDTMVNEKRMEQFAQDIKEAYGPLLTRSMKEINYGEILPKIIRVSARYGTRLPDDFVLVTRQLLYFDRYAKLLAPSLNVFSDPRLAMLLGADLAHI